MAICASFNNKGQRDGMATHIDLTKESEVWSISG
jgi:hypothetical protein